MSDQPSPASQPSELRHPEEIPLVYADGVVNLFRPPGIVKFYMIRYDPGVPTLGGLGEPTPAAQTTCAQIVMPTSGFMAMTLFFQDQLKHMLERNEVDRNLYEHMVATQQKSV